MQTRCLVLRQAGFIVDEAYSLLGIVGGIKSDSIDAVLLCHTIPRNEQRWVISSIRNARRLLPIICIKESAYDSQQDGCLSSTNEPDDLLAAVQEAIRQPH